jgi:hypothetical protein
MPTTAKSIFDADSTKLTIGLPCSHLNQRKRAQHGNQQHLQHVVLGERAHECCGDDVHQKRYSALVRGVRHVRLYGRRIDVREIHVHPLPGLPQIHSREPDPECDRRQHFEIDDCLQRHAPHAHRIGHPRDPVHHRAENDRRDQHADELDERVAQRLHLYAEPRIEFPERDPDHHTGEHPHPELRVPAFRTVESCCGGVSGHRAHNTLALGERIDKFTHRAMSNLVRNAPLLSFLETSPS